MDPSLIDKYGITAFENFLSKSDLFSSKINSDDKYPSWDGEVIIYNSSSHNNNNIKGRIPVQVKSANRKANSKESFSIKKNDLNNYLNDGGIILIRPIFQASPTDYTIFIKSLPPLTIKQLLQKNQNQNKTVRVILERIDEINAFEKRCIHFLNTRPRQYDYNNIIDIKELKETAIDLLIETIPEGSFEDSILSEHCCFYKKLSNCIIPVDLQLKSVGLKKQSIVAINDKVYFDQIIDNKDIEGNRFVEFSPVIGIKITNDNTSKLLYSSNDDSLFVDCLKAFDFISNASQYGVFRINDILFSNITINLDEDFNKSHSFFKHLSQLFEYFHIKYDNLSLNLIYDNETLFDKLINLFIKKCRITFIDKPKHFIQTLNLFDNIRIICFKQDEGTFYRGFDFSSDLFSKDEFTLRVELQNLQFPCSRFLILDNPSIIQSIDGYWDEVIEDLIRLYVPEIFPNYELFMLNCIKAFDDTGTSEFLVIATQLNELIKDAVNDPVTYTINKFQIIKRERILSPDEKRDLLLIDQQSSSNIEKLCCVNLLLDYKERFELLYEQLSDGDKIKFNNWPIMNFYTNNSNI